MSAAADPFMITSRERLKYTEQFKSLQPQNDFVTGQQARGFFLQSQLPPVVLGQIWALADTDADGKMNIDEFSMACKLINLKLRGFEVPKALPPTMIASLRKVGGTPILTPTAGMSPAQSITGLSNIVKPMPPSIIPQVAAQPPIAAPIIPKAMPSMIPQVAAQPPMVVPIIPGPMPPVLPQVGAQQPPPIIPMQPLMNQAIVPPQPAQVQPLIQTIVPQNISQPSTNSALLLDLLGSVNNTAPIPSVAENSAVPGVLPAPPTPPSGTQSRSISISEKVPSIESPSSANGSAVEWAIKGPAKLKYTQLFNTTDRTRSGVLTGAQARGVFLQTNLPQQTLAKIWALSDMDSDGRLGCEEFILAMYLCDLAASGEPIPVKLPSELIPPTFRKPVSRHGSIPSATNSRHGSVSSQGAPPVVDTDFSHYSQTSFEDKRKENFDKGQAELERRRRLLQDTQRKEQEERERKEREEAEKKEKARLEAERRQQEELERNLQIQRELEQEREEKRKRELDQKEAARKEMEKQRQIEWENQRIDEMQQQRQREQEHVLKLKAQNQAHTIDLGTLNDKVKELSQKICDTRVAVTSVKTVIDGMRSTRDTQMTEMSSLKARIKEQNAKLVHLSQEKAKLENKTGKDGTSPEVFAAKQLNINQLRTKVDNIKEAVEPKQTDVNANTEQLNELKIQLKTSIDICEEIYALYDSHRNQVMELKNNKKNETLTSAWDMPATQDTWSTSTALPTTVTSTEPVAVTGYHTYRAIYEFTARNSDEITFVPGDIVMVPFEQNAEPGWLAGKINGHTGWFPESYVEKVEDEDTVEPAEDTNYNQSHLETTPVVKAKPEEYPTNTDEAIAYISCYPYESTEIGDLTFGTGEYITVIKKDGDWWTGTIGDRTGIFPSNYVQEASAIEAINVDATTDNYYSSEQTAATQHFSDDVQNQEETDTEVSEINTQPKTDSVHDTYTRPMSTSSTTSNYRGKKGEVAQVIAPYEATSNEQLSLQRGQYIMIRKKTDSGWWEGELQVRGVRRQIGWFPATYVKLLQSGRLSGRSTPVSGGKIPMSEAILDKVISLYPYKAQNDDELSFEKDDIISVLGRDEPEWWRGECQGLTGLFPSNYVGPFVTSGNI